METDSKFEFHGMKSKILVLFEEKIGFYLKKKIQVPLHVVRLNL